MCSIERISDVDAGKSSGGIRWTSVSEGRLSRWRLRVREEKIDGVEI